MASGAVLAGCTATEAIRESSATPGLSGPTEPAAVLAPTAPVPLAIATSAALYTSAPVVVLAADGDAGGQAGAASAAVALGAPMLLTPGAGADPADATAVTGEVARLGPQALLTVGQAAQDWAAQSGGGPRVVPATPDAVAGLVKVDPRDARVVDPATLTDAVGTLDRKRPELLAVAVQAEAPSATATAAPVGPVAAGVPDLPLTTPAEPLAGLVVLARSGNDQVAPLATARAAGVPVHVLRTPDPRGSGELVTALSSAPQEKVLALGAGFGTVEQLQQRLAVVRTGVQLPGGGQLAFPGRRMIALYGTPGDRGARLAGRAGPRRVDRPRARTSSPSTSRHSDLTGRARHSRSSRRSRPRQAGADGDYSNEVDDRQDPPVGRRREGRGHLRHARPAARPDRLPHPGQAVRGAARRSRTSASRSTPSGGCSPGQVHLVQIGSVERRRDQPGGDWLAGLTRERNLPQKVLMLHQFRTSMIVGRERLNTAHDELALMVHADGFGTQGMKRDTWNALRQSSPNVYWGWKNFIDEDRPMLDPAQTMQVSPDIVFVSYQ